MPPNKVSTKANISRITEEDRLRQHGVGQFADLLPITSDQTYLQPSSDARLELLRFEERVCMGNAQIVVAIFSTTQLIHSEGQRATNITRELSHRKIPVVFAPWRWDESEWTVQERLDEGVLQIPIDVILKHSHELFYAFDNLNRIVIFEFPHPDFFESVAIANATGWITIYDVIDDWEHFKRARQAPWYDKSFEENMVATTDAVFAVNEYLADKMRSYGRDSIEIIANGVREGIEKIDEPRALDRGELTIGYFGHLSSAWLDWDLLIEVARTMPSWLLYFIGYGGKLDKKKLPSNIILLGKRQQSTLSSYAANWDVGIVPFKPGSLAAGADAIKVYDYLAMGLPVVATGIYPPPGGEDFFMRADGTDDFIEKVRMASKLRDEDAEARRAFVASCTWSHRVDAILHAVRSDHQRVGEKRALFLS